MSIFERINSDLVSAMKARDKERTIALRGLKAAVKYREIDKRDDLTDEDVIAVVSSTVKKHRDSIEQYEKAGRDDLVREEKAQLDVALAYLPEQLGPEEIEKQVDEIIAEVGASGPSDIGKVMKGIMPKLKGRADGKLTKEIVTRRLS
jgi:uncharacterized protein YqeY